MRIASCFCIVLGLVVLGFCGFDFFVSGVFELFPVLIGSTAVLVGIIGLRVRTALARITEVGREISEEKRRNRTQTTAERLRDEGLLSPSGERVSNEEIDGILA